MTKQYKSFTLPLASCTNPKDYQTLQTIWTQLKNIWGNQVWPEHTLMTQETSKGTLKGAWWKTYIHKTQIKGRSNWGLGENAIYFRGLMECMRQVMVSCEERRDVLPYAEQYDWDESKLNEINQAISEAGLKMQKHNVLRGICRSHGDVYPSETPALRLDLSVFHDQACYRDEESLKNDRELIYRLRVSKTNWVTLCVKIPMYCQPTSWTDPKVYSKPLIRETAGGGLVVQVGYETPSGKAEDYGLDSKRVFAIDLGQVRAFAGSWYDSRTGEWETGFNAHAETDRVNHELAARCRDVGRLIDKNNRLGLIIKGQVSPDPVDVDAYERRAGEIGFLREKITRQKGKVAWLIARDVVDHAVRHHCGVIKMEDLGFVQEAYGSKWAHGLVRQRLEERARAFGITVEVVPAKDSSRLDPFTLESVTPRSDRSVVTSGGVMDRDDVASLNLASRKSTRACRALKRKTGSPVKMGGQRRLSRDRRKVTATPRRACPVSGKSRVRCLVKSFKSGGLRSVIVAVDCGSALDHNGLAARISLKADPRWACDDTV